jgi:hypothetical protein
MKPALEKRGPIRGDFRDEGVGKNRRSTSNRDRSFWEKFDAFGAVSPTM